MDIINIKKCDWQLFLDDHIIQSKSHDLTKHFGEVTERNIIMTFDKPWEGNVSAYYTIFKDHGKMVSDKSDDDKTYDFCRMYYRGSHYNRSKNTFSKYVTCYAESLDGISDWVRPNLGIVEYNGSTDNNILMYCKYGDNFTVFIDHNPDRLDNQKYLALDGGKEHKLRLLSSEDAINWNDQGPIIKGHTFDSQNILIWDKGKYNLYFRSYQDLIRRTYRLIMYSSSHDLKQWSTPVLLKYGDKHKYELYTSNIKKYHRSDIYIALSNRFSLLRRVNPKTPTGIYDVILMSSRDGFHFNRYNEAWLKPGDRLIKWGSRSGMMAYSIMETNKDPKDKHFNNKELSIFMNEGYYLNRCLLKRYTLRLDGFVYFRGSYDGSYLVTKILKFDAHRMFINFRSSAMGHIRVELQNAKGTHYNGFKMNECNIMFGDDTNRNVTWKLNKKVKSLIGKHVVVKFFIKDSDLYSFAFI